MVVAFCGKYIYLLKSQSSPSVNIHEIIILIASFICAAILLVKGRRTGKAGRYLALSLVVEGVLMLLLGLIYTRGVTYVPAADGFMTLFLLINPLLYWIPVYYVTSAEREQNNLVHYFFPAAAVFFVVYFIAVSCASDDAALLAGIIRGESVYPREVSSSFNIIESLDYLRFSISSLCTVILLAYSFFAFFSYRRTLAEYYSNLDNKSTLYVIILLVLMCLKAALLYSSALNADLFQMKWFYPVRTCVFLIFYAFTTVVALNIKFTAADLRRLIAESSSSSSQPEDVTDEEIIRDDNIPASDIIESRLDKMVEEKFFTDPEINLLEFSSMIKVNREYVSRYLHNKYGETFSSYVNRLRIEHSKTLLKKPDAQVADVADQCGFATVSTYYRNFNRLVGCSPRDYQRRIR